MSHLQEFDGKALQDVARGRLDLDDSDEEEKAEREKAEKESEGLIERLKGVIGDDVEEIRATTRLVESPACLVVGEHDMGAQMKRIMEAAGQPVPDSKPILEINPRIRWSSASIRRADEERFADLARIVLDQANLAEGGSARGSRSLRGAPQPPAPAAQRLLSPGLAAATIAARDPARRQSRYSSPGPLPRRSRPPRPPTWPTCRISSSCSQLTSPSAARFVTTSCRSVRYRRCGASGRRGRASA
jgi:hypothetical protein